MLLPWILCILLAAALAAALIKICLMRHDIRQISDQFDKRLTENTNELITTGSGDPAIRAVAAKLNAQLQTFRQQQLKYINGDLELRNAVTNISHDLRTPLTAIRGYLDLLQDEPQSPAAARYFDVISERTAQMQLLTEELFRYSLILSEEPDSPAENVCVNAVLEESIAGFYGAFMSSGIQPEITMPEQQIFCKCSRMALTRIFSNLLQNARKYSKGDLQISLSAEGRLCFSNLTNAVEYTHIEHLFDRFYTVESAQHSTGLGLAIARTLTEQMGGKIYAECDDDRLRVIVELPVTAVSPEE